MRPVPVDHPKVVRVGIIGTGVIASELARLGMRMSDLRIDRMLTRQLLESRVRLGEEFPLTQSIDELIEHSDIVVECSGDVIHATEVIGRALEAGRPVVTMNSEFHVTCGSHFVGKGYLTEAEGDQPGSTAALRRDALEMGFKPLVYGNMKGFLKLDPTPEEMEYWADRNGVRVHQTVSFTDGTKVQIEQAFVANAFAADIAKQGLLGVERPTFEAAAAVLAEAAQELGSPISDFVLSPGQAPGVFIVATHDAAHQNMLRYLKLGDGPHYTLLRPFHLCALEIPKTIRRVMAGDPPLLHNSAHPTIGVAAVAKTDLLPGDELGYGIGSYKVRGEAVRMVDAPKHVPLGILSGAQMTRRVARGETITIDDVDLPDSNARDIALGIVKAATA